MGNCCSLCPPAIRGVSKKRKALPIETLFEFPSPLPTFSSGDEGFGNGVIDLGGGLKVSQVSSFNKVWATHEGGPGNLGATFFEPSPIPQGFFMLGFYCQPNNKPFFGRVLVVKHDGSTDKEALQKPIDYTLVWNSESLKINQDGFGYVWLPTAPNGYKAIGHVVTTSPEKPSLDKVRCIRSDFTEESETESWVWGPGTTSDSNGINVYNLRPRFRGGSDMGVGVGTFIAQNGGTTSAVACLKNKNSVLASMPNFNQITSLFQAYSPFIYFHPDESYLPSSVTWLFTNGALLYTEGQESNPVPIDPTGSNLPQGGSNDGAYWIDLPADQSAKDRVKKGDLQNSQVYLHIKPMFGATITDIAIWIFYPFNGPAKAKVELINIPLGKIGEHVGDWEHLTLRISNFNGELQKVYFSQHSKGIWVDSPDLEYQNGNKFVAYASLHGHAHYPKPGLVLQGSGGIGIRNDTAKSNKVMDAGSSYSVVSAEYLSIAEPFWLNYYRQWGPNITYKIADELKKVEKLLPGKLKAAFEKVINSLPDEVLGEEGPTGPKVKNNWDGDEVAS